MKVVGRFQGARRPMLGLAAAGVLGLLLTGLGFWLDVRRALFAYLFAFTYWVGLALGALILLGTFHATRARWPVLLRRMLETMAATLALFPVLFIPILAGMGELFVWVTPGPGLPEEMLRLIEHKRPYLNVPFWAVRAALYFVVWIAVSELLLRWSRRQDEEAGLKLTVWQRRLGAGSLPLVALALSFASLDWLMSLEPRWVSTIYALYYFAGSFLGAFAALAVATVLARGPNLYGGLVGGAHLASLGKLLLAFTVFWAYIAFDQYMLVWIADLPDEVDWYLLRTHGGWGAVAIVVAVTQFAVPFFPLLSRRLKQRPPLLAAVAVWILAAHVLDTYWLVLPVVAPQAPRLHWADFTAFIGVGGLTLAFALWRMQGHHTVPVRDPYLLESLRYSHL